MSCATLSGKFRHWLVPASLVASSLRHVEATETWRDLTLQGPRPVARVWCQALWHRDTHPLHACVCVTATRLRKVMTQRAGR